MQHISELVRVARTVEDTGSSPLALRVGRPWGCERVRFVRSSATHVFVCDPPAILRFSTRALEEVGCLAELSVRIAAEGGPVAPARPSREGALAVEVDGYVGCAFEAVDGEQLEADALSLEQARSWGRALATFHDFASRLEPPPRVPHWLDRVRASAEALGHANLDELSRLPTESTAFGIVHGDPELDNVIWAPDPVFVDVDDAAWSWFAADIAFALRDFAPRGRAPDPASKSVSDFVAGYREVRPLGHTELARLPLFARAHALVTLARLQHTLDEPTDPDWPAWATSLRRRLERVAEELRAAIAA